MVHWERTSRLLNWDITASIVTRKRQWVLPLSAFYNSYKFCAFFPSSDTEKFLTEFYLEEQLIMQYLPQKLQTSQKPRKIRFLTLQKCQVSHLSTSTKRRQKKLLTPSPIWKQFEFCFKFYQLAAIPLRGNAAEIHVH